MQRRSIIRRWLWRIEHDALWSLVAMLAAVYSTAPLWLPLAAVWLAWRLH